MGTFIRKIVIVLSSLIFTTATYAANEKAIFAGGCFWCMEPPFEGLKGVISVTSGYVGGGSPNPTYKEVSAGGTGHAEAVEILFDPAVISYRALLDTFWHNIDPVAVKRQFCDSGDQYRSAIFYLSAVQAQHARVSKAALKKSTNFKEPIATEITAAGKFFPAEEYHQDYYKKNPLRYKYYRNSCGRDSRLKEIWGEQAGH